MKRVLTAVVLVPLVLLVVFKAPVWLFALVAGLVMLLCLHEYLGLLEHYGIEPLRWPAYLLSILVIVGAFARIYAEINPSIRGYGFLLPLESILVLVIPFLLPLLFGIPLLFRRDLRLGLAAAASSAFGVLYIATPLSLLITMRWTPDLDILLVFVLLSVWAGDIAAYYVGKNLGRHKLAPAVSPNKTWEGAIASLLASVGIAFLVFHYAVDVHRLFRPPGRYFSFPGQDYYLESAFRLYTSSLRHLLFVCSLGVVANIAAQFGDLFESAIKRGAQVKDSGSLLPGHGGILDRIDALLFAVPAVWYYAELTQLF
ncbi:MAG TPA: phosphatidate cytidylyltransferase [Candidatus Angelobacter sp.]